MLSMLLCGEGCTEFALTHDIDMNKGQVWLLLAHLNRHRS